MEQNPMNAPRDNQICRFDEDGDRRLDPVILHLWAGWVVVQRTFGAEVIFNHLPPNYETRRHELVRFFVPRDHPQITAIKLHLTNALGPLCQELAASRREVDGCARTF
jgi:hypothetical protein